MGIAKTVNLSSLRKDGGTVCGTFACIATWSTLRGGTVGDNSRGRAEARAVSRDNGCTKAHSAQWGEAASATQSASHMHKHREATGGRRATSRARGR